MRASLHQPLTFRAGSFLLQKVPGATVREPASPDARVAVLFCFVVLWRSPRILKTKTS